MGSAETLDPAELARRLVAALNHTEGRQKGKGGQTALAFKLRVSQPTVSRWIAGIHRPSWGEVVAMSAILEAHDNAKESC